MSAEPIPPLPPSNEALLEQGLPIPAIANAVPDFLLAAAYLAAWLAPTRLPAALPRALLLTLLLEFIVIHSAAFMGNVAYSTSAPAARVRGVLLLGLFYTLFVLGACKGFHTWWPLLSFWLLVANRLGGIFTGQAQPGAERQHVMAMWAGGAVCYLLAVMLGVILPLPHLGLAPAIVAQLHLPSSGLWVAQPWRAFASGAVYFTAMGALELNGFKPFQGVRVQGEH